MRDIDHWAAIVQEAEDGYASLTKQDDAEHDIPSSRIPLEKYRRLTVAQLLDILKKNVAPYEKDFTVKFTSLKTGESSTLAIFSTRVDPESNEV